MHAFVFCFLVLCSLSIASFGKATKSLSGFSVDLIHHDSPLSPYYNPSLTQSERIKNAALRSIARSKRLGLSQNENEYPKTITTPDHGKGEYLMRFYIGTLLLKGLLLRTQVVILFGYNVPLVRNVHPTGSDLIWVQCSPCEKCSPQNTPLFDPRKSSTFRSLSCDSQPCTLLPLTWHRCTKSGECKFFYSYGDRSYTIGKLGVDSIHFDSKGVRKSLNFQKFTFGCGYNISEDPDDTKRSTGLVGLGTGPLSLTSQLGDQIGHKFSYCFVPFDSNSTSKMKFGNAGTIKGKGVVSTPLIIKSSENSFYYVNFEGISIGKKKVAVSKSETDGNMFIDSGTTFTMLQQSLYNKFVTLVNEVYGSEVEKNPPKGYDICIGTDANVLDIVFHFTGAKIRLKPINMLTLVNGNLYCMLVQSTSAHGFNVLGNQAQTNFQVEYDLHLGKISFAPADCAKH